MKIVNFNLNFYNMQCKKCGAELTDKEKCCDCGDCCAVCCKCGEDNADVECGCSQQMDCDCGGDK